MRLERTLLRRPRSSGLCRLVERGQGLARELSAWRLRLAGGARVELERPGEEAVLVLQEGSGRLTVKGRVWPVSRRSVFEEAATGLYLPPGQALEVRADSDLEAVLFSAASDGGGTATVVDPDGVEVASRGRGSYARVVHDIFVGDAHCRRLMVGETFNPPGNWSSYPPHKHDGRDGEPRLEELYYYRIDPDHGFAHQMLYTTLGSGGESVTHTVRDGDAVLLPYGYHPVSAPPGYRLYYLWALAGEQRRLALFEDPDHRWIHQAP